jgi:O-methyltransferase involved in polyketide biosynthesis
MLGKDFDGVADTLYIPLTARIYVSKRFPEYFFDSKSLELEAAIPGESIQAGSNEYTMIASAARYHNLDQIVHAYIAAHHACNIVNVGCGLETMFWRVEPDAPDALFYEMDLPEVIETRRRILGEPERDKLVAGNAFDLTWASGIDTSLPTLIVVSGVFQYFHNADVLGFIADAKKVFADAELIFDATNTKGLEYVNKYVKKTGNASALMYCAIDDPTAFAREAGCELLEVRPFYTAARRILKGKVNLYSRIAMAIADRTGRAFLLHMKL